MDLSIATLQPLITLIVPILIWLTKLVIPKIPKPVLPILAPILGALIDIGAHAAGLYESSSPLLGGLFGGLAVWLHQVKEQIVKTIPEPPSG